MEDRQLDGGALSDAARAALTTAPAQFAAQARQIEAAEWSAMLLDGDWRIRWVSSELSYFLGESDPDRLGFGRHLSAALLLEAYTRTVTPASMERILRDVGPYILGDLVERGVRPEDAIAAELLPLLEQLEPEPPPPMWGTAFDYVNPDGIEEFGGYVVKTLFIRSRDGAGDAGWTVLFDIAVRPRLVSLLARGDPEMYERMARLVQPGPQAAAILFCDLDGSTTLSRRLPTAEYFRLIRRLWTAIDGAVAEGCGIVGKHAGDGASAFFLATDLGDDSRAARAAIATARRIHELSAEVFRNIADEDCLMKVGIHWGAALYMGQLVPGGRLDVTALGDEVNEAARIQEAARADETLASKQLVERLSADDAAALGMDPRAITYRLLGDVVSDRPKITRDAGSIPVTVV